MLGQALPAVPAVCAAPRGSAPHGHLAAAAPARPWAPCTGRRRSGGGSSSLRRPCAQPQQPWEGDLPDLQPPKFQPFTPRNALQQAMVRFRHRTDLADGDALLVAPLHADWVPDAAELLASSFADSLAASLYKRYLQRQIKAYLEAHINLPPKAVVLAALRMPRELAEAAEAEAQAEAAQPVAAAAAAALAAWPSSRAGSMGSGAEDGLLGSSNGSGSSSTSGSTSSSTSSGVQLGGLDSALSSCDDAAAAATSAPLQLNGNSNGMLGSSDSGSEEAAAHGAAGSMASAATAPAAALATVGSGSLLAPGNGAVLTSVLELSFSPSTRTKHLTLQSPDSRPYLCNMAVAEAHRRRGYGLALLTAAEALVRSLGENEIYLHTRVQDTPAQLLYAKAGYEQVAADSFLVRLIGLDQRRLLRKRLQR